MGPGAGAEAVAGDWLEVEPAGGGALRRGQILEVLGEPRHRRYRVRWEDGITIHYPAGHERVVPRAQALAGREGGAVRSDDPAGAR